jgi:hypothetical protein
MFELMLCSLFTLVPDYLYRRYAQGKQIGKEITLFSMWYELRWVASCMRAEAAAGKVPHIWCDHDYPVYASATDNTGIEAQVIRAVQAAVKPLQDELKAVNDKIAIAQTKLKDATGKARLQAAAPGRKTLSPDLAALLERGGIAVGDGNMLRLKH